MSPEFSSEVQKTLKLGYRPSAVQIRYRGIEGMLTKRRHERCKSTFPQLDANILDSSGRDYSQHTWLPGPAEIFPSLRERIP